MSVRCEGGTIYLEGRCGAEDAERLLVALSEAVGTRVDASALTRLHLAVAQVLLAFRPEVAARPLDPILAAAVFDPLIEVTPLALPSGNVCE